MPFDSLTEIDTPAARVATLVRALRQEMPPKFKWNFDNILYETECGSEGCALGLAVTLWPQHKDVILRTNGLFGPKCVIAELFGITPSDVSAVFFNNGGGRYGARYPRSSKVTPHQVAAALEAAFAANAEPAAPLSRPR